MRTEWHCAACGKTQPNEDQDTTTYVAGDSEPCVYCHDGTATVRAEANNATTHPSYRFAYRSMLYVANGPGWDAHIKVDYDEENPLDIDKIRNVLFSLLSITSDNQRQVSARDIDRVEVHRTGKGHHLRLYLRSDLPAMDPRTTIRIQEALGDDPMRVKLNTARVDRDEPNWNVLWTEKYVNGTLKSLEEFDKELTASVQSIISEASKQ